MLSPSTILAAGILLTLILYHRRRRSPLPPGPPRLPLIGNLHQAPKKTPWLTFQSWVRQYGPLVSLDMGGQIVILVGSYETAKDLLDKRASIYSSRPRMVFGFELVCKKLHLMLRPYGEEFLAHQRLEAPVLSPRASATYMPVQDVESLALVKRLMGDGDLAELLEVFTTSTMYSLAYGQRILTGKEWQVKTAHEVLDNFVQAFQVGTWIVDALPFLKHLPKAPWAKTAEAWHELPDKLFKADYEAALERKSWNWTKEFKNSKEAEGMSEKELRWELGVLVAAGIETTMTTMRIAILALLQHPHVIEKAQKELDDMVGNDRLPGYDDLEKLPYLQAILEENFRWRHIAPCGIPHATTKDDHYNGYFIPKGSTIVPMFKSMREDETLFDAPWEFRPERWLGKTQINNWGYGRRVCPGRFIAKNSLGIALARILWTFNVNWKDGKQADVDESFFVDGVVSAPMPFQAVFEPRSEKHRMIVEREHASADKDVDSLLEKVHTKQIAAGLNPYV